MFWLQSLPVSVDGHQSIEPTNELVTCGTYHSRGSLRVLTLRPKRKFKVIFDGTDHVLATSIDHHGPPGAVSVLIFHFHRLPSDAWCEMLLTPTLALLSIIFNFCALLHLTSDGNGLSRRRWHALDRAIYALEEATVTAYENYLDILAPPPLTSSPAYFSPLRHAEWVYRSSAVRILDLVDGSSRVKLVSDVASPSLLLPSPPIPTNPVASVDIIPPTLTLVPLSYPATLEQFPTYNASTPLVAISSVTRFLEFAGLSCLGYLLVFAWMKVNIRTISRFHLLLNAP